MKIILPKFYENQERKQRRKKRKKQARINYKAKIILFSNFEKFPCFYCKKTLSLKEATIEHIIPLSIGGTSELNNLTIACGHCNRKRGKIQDILNKKRIKLLSLFKTRLT